MTDDLESLERLHRDLLTRTEHGISRESLEDILCFLEMRVPQLITVCRDLQKRLKAHHLDSRLWW